MDSEENHESPVEKKQKLSVETTRKFPSTLEGFGYKFKDGKLVHIVTGESFEFRESETDHQHNQDRYEALGDVITEFVYDLLVTEGKLKKLTIPVDASPSEATTFIFHSEDAFSCSKLLVLIHGCGAVRAGQWARRLIINDCLDSGTQLPFIKRAQELNYGVVVMNTNDNKRVVNESVKKIRGSEDATKHAFYVWENLIYPSAATHIAIVAHSFGGIVTVNLANTFPSLCQEKVFAIAFTDSPHSLYCQKTLSTEINWFRKVARNWVSNHHPIDTSITRGTFEEVTCVSAGTQKHEYTSWSSFESIFAFIEERYKAVSEVSNSKEKSKEARLTQTLSSVIHRTENEEERSVNS